MNFFKLIIAFVLVSGPVFSGGYSAHVKKAMEYISKRGVNLTPLAVINLALISREFHITTDMTEAQRLLLKNPAMALKPFLRVLDGNFKLSHLEVRALRGWKGIYASVTHCDIYPLHWDFFPTLRNLSSKHNETAPMAIAALRALEWMHCTPNHSAFEKAMEHFTKQLPELLSKSTPGSELWVDIVLAMYHAGKANWVGPEQIAELARHQRVDGSWENRDMLTTKALWVLLYAESQKQRR